MQDNQLRASFPNIQTTVIWRSRHSPITSIGLVRTRAVFKLTCPATSQCSWRVRIERWSRHGAGFALWGAVLSLVVSNLYPT